MQDFFCYIGQTANNAMNHGLLVVLVINTKILYDHSIAFFMPYAKGRCLQARLNMIRF